MCRNISILHVCAEYYKAMFLKDNNNQDMGPIIPGLHRVHRPLFVDEY